MPTQTFEYCSLQYLNQWIIHDSRYCDALANGSKSTRLDALKDAAGFYKISRNLPKAGDTEKGLPRYKPLLDVIESVKPADFKKDPVQRIRKVESTISHKYGGRGVLSLTTKVLWLKVKRPIILYDKQARTAIGTKDGDLDGYYTEWREAFELFSGQIATACKKLVRMSKYTADKDLATATYIKDATAQTWFHERVFDIYLWNKGDRS